MRHGLVEKIKIDRRHSPDDGLDGAAMDRAMVEVLGGEGLRLRASNGEMESERCKNCFPHGSPFRYCQQVRRMLNASQAACNLER
jgi:hypothetical protein